MSKDFKFQLLKTSEKILSILKGLNSSKEAGIDKLSGKFLRDGAHVLAWPISQLCNHSIKLNSFTRSCKVKPLKFNHFLKKDSKTDPQNYFTSPPVIKNYWKDCSWPKRAVFDEEQNSLQVSI